jgi:PAS domain S-box-containing protein
LFAQIFDVLSRENKKDDMFRILFETAGEGLVVANKEGVIDIVNPRIEELFGYKRAELIGQKVEILIPNRFSDSHQALRDGYFKQPKKRPMGLGLNLYGQRKDGTEFPIEVSLNHFVKDDEPFVMALITDVTERKKVEEMQKNITVELEEKVRERTVELEESQQLYRAIARRFPNGTINVFDTDLNYIFVEGQGLYNLGITSENLMGTSYLNRVPESHRADIENKLKKALRGFNQTIELDLGDRHYLLQAVGLRTEGGKIDRLLVVESNITKQKKAEKEVRKALFREQELGELKSRFVSMASHEFRTPLGTILSSVTLLEKYLGLENSEEKREKHIDRIKSSVRNLTNVLNDFLSLDKLQSGKVEAKWSEFDVQELMEELRDELLQLKKKKQEIRFVHEGERVIKSDPNILKNIAYNLLSNAVKYSEPDGVIDFRSSIKGKKFILEVQDYGIGIPKEDQKHLFERFFRAENAINIQGTGLGLNIVGKYLELLGGKIKFESQENQGTTFEVTLPTNT